MIIKEFFSNVWGFIKGKVITFGKWIIDAIAGASVATVAKFAVGVGVGIATVALAFKLLKDKFNAVRSNKKQDNTPVENILARNFADYRKKGSLHPRMKNVSNEAWFDLCRKSREKGNGEKYGWVKKFIKSCEKNNGHFIFNEPDDFEDNLYDPDDIDLYETAKHSWWTENCSWFDDRPYRTVKERYDDFCDYFFNNNVDGEKSPDYDGDLYNVWSHGRLHGWGYDHY